MGLLLHYILEAFIAEADTLVVRLARLLITEVFYHFSSSTNAQLGFLVVNILL